MKTTFELHQEVQETSYVSLYRENESEPRILDIIFAGREKCGESYSFERLSFPVYVFEYVLAGRGELQLDGAKHPLRKGCSFVYGPRIPCSIVSSTSDPLEKRFVAFQISNKTLEELFPLNTHFMRSTERILGFADTVDELFRAAFSGSEFSNPLSRRYLEIVFLKWMEFSKASERIQQSSRSHFLRIKQLIEDNFLEIRRIEDICKAANLTASYVSRLFRQYFHMTPYHYLLKKKMEYALDLLSNSELSVAETALRTGFEDPFHFSRVFKRVMHKPPSAFKHGSRLM